MSDIEPARPHPSHDGLHVHGSYTSSLYRDGSCNVCTILQLREQLAEAKALLKQTVGIWGYTPDWVDRRDALLAQEER